MLLTSFSQLIIISCLSLFCFQKIYYLPKYTTNQKHFFSSKKTLIFRNRLFFGFPMLYTPILLYSEKIREYFIYSSNICLYQIISVKKASLRIKYNATARIWNTYNEPLSCSWRDCGISAARSNASLTASTTTNRFSENFTF